MTTSAGSPARARPRLSHIAVPLLVVAVVVVMVVPMPAALLDVLLATNISLAAVILLTAMMARRALDFSVFPSLLLVTTLVRLALNVSSTRLILSKGQAGHVIEAFGHVVVGGNLVIGLVIFVILVVIQFVVITAGAGRVAEVAARFTLDAMPGKQMAIDADLNSGLIDEKEARRRRLDVAREADFFGAMDGASKFVKGDAMAAVVIVLVNLVGGFAIGVVQQHVALSDALSRYSLLSVGDGLVSQIPALLISVASGIVVTRVESEDDGGLGAEVVGQLMRSATAIRIAAVAVTLIGIMPGLPKLPFLLLAVVLFVISARAGRTPEAAEPVEEQPAPSEEEQPLADTATQVDPLELELAPDLLDLIDPLRGGNLMDRVKALRRRVAKDLGLVVPAIRTRDSVLLPASAYAIKVHGVEVGRGDAPAGFSLVIGEDAAHVPGTPTVDPVFGLPARWVRIELAEQLAAEGMTVIDRASVIVTHLSEVVRNHATDLLSRQDVQTLVDAVKNSSPVVAAEIGNDGVPLATVQRVLQELLAERVSIRDLTRILEGVTAKGRETRHIEALVEAARAVLGPAISVAAATDGKLPALSLEPLLEQSLLETLRTGDNGSWLAVDAVRMEQLLQGLNDAVIAAEEAGHRPVVVCSAQLRPAIRRLVAPARPGLRVIAYTELARTLTVEPVGVIRLAARAAA